MIPRKFHFFAFSFVMSLLMSGVMSLAMISVDNSNVLAALPLWPKAWFASMLVAFPTSILVGPATKRLVNRIVAAK